MTQAQLTSLLQDIVSGVGTVGDFAAGIDPALKVPVVVGKAILSQVPGLEATIANWISGNAPTQEQQDTAAAQLAVLSNPNGL